MSDVIRLCIGTGNIAGNVIRNRLGYRFKWQTEEVKWLMSSLILLDTVFTRASNLPLLFMKFPSLNENLMISNYQTNRFRHCSYLNAAAVLLFKTVNRFTFSLSRCWHPFPCDNFSWLPHWLVFANYFPHRVSDPLFPGIMLLTSLKYEGWNFNSGNYLFTTDTK